MLINLKNYVHIHTTQAIYTLSKISIKIPVAKIIINLGGGNKVQIHLNDDEDEDEIEQGENTIKSEDKIHLDEDEDDK